MATAVQAPDEGDYWTDGARLVEVIGQTKSGDWHVEDVATGLTMDMTEGEFGSGVWKLVRHGVA
jgi:hypothetical protein